MSIIKNCLKNETRKHDSFHCKYISVVYSTSFDDVPGRNVLSYILITLSHGYSWMLLSIILNWRYKDQCTKPLNDDTDNFNAYFQNYLNAAS